jgi:flagellar protein FlaG
MSATIDAVAPIAASAILRAGNGESGGRSPASRERGGDPPPTGNIHAAVAQLNASMKLSGTKLSFSVDAATKETVITVVDSGTGEVIRQIPSETVLKISEQITAMLGAIFDAVI